MDKWHWPRQKLFSNVSRKVLGSRKTHACLMPNRHPVIPPEVFTAFGWYVSLWSSHTEPIGGDNGCLGMRQSSHGKSGSVVSGQTE